MAFIDRFYSKQRLDQYEAEITAAAEIADPAARLLRLHELAEKPYAAHQNRWGFLLSHKTAMGVALLGPVAGVAFLLTTVTSAAVIAPALAVATGIYFTPLLAPVATLILNAQRGRVHALTGQVWAARREAFTTASLETMGQSPQLDAALTALPQLKTQFGEEAIRKARAQTAAVMPAPVPVTPGA